MNEFTQGTWSTNWTVNDDNGSIRIYAIDDSERDPQPEAIADVWTCDCLQNLTDEGIANLRLILAAPEMYELLKSFAYQAEFDNTVTAVLRTKAEELLARIDGKEGKQ